MNVLDEIISNKYIEIKQLYSKISISTAIKKLKNLPHPRNFKSAISKPSLNLIAEINRGWRASRD